MNTEYFLLLQLPYFSISNWREEPVDRKQVAQLFFDQ